MKLNAKLIVSDFDGTLLNSQRQVTPEVKEEISRYVADGGIFAVCTGRMMASILPRVRQLGLKGLVIACQGTVIADIGSGKLIKCGGLNGKDAAEVCAALEERGYHVNIYNGDRMFSNLPPENEYLQEYEKITGIHAEHVGLPLSEFVRKNNLTCQKITSLCFPEDKLTVYRYMLGKFEGRFDVTYSSDVLVEVSPFGENKGEALKFLAAYYHIPVGETVAIGDNLNDLSMILAAGTGIAVGNATPALKDAADVVTVTNDENAVSEVIKQYGYIH